MTLVKHFETVAQHSSVGIIYLRCSCLFSGWCYFAEATEEGLQSEVKKASKESSRSAGGSSRHAGLRL